jgi:error-prone DNA polymerase
MISGLQTVHAEAILHARRDGTFTSVADLTRRTRLGQSVISQLSAADVFESLNQDRRTALWQALAQEQKPVHQPLFDGLDAGDDEISSLPQLTPEQQVIEDYRTVGLSLKAHPLSFHRSLLDRLKITPTSHLKNKSNNRHLRVAGMVILRQRPSTAKGITFVTIEDETGTANLVVKPTIWERYYKIAKGSSAWIAHGKLEKKNGVIHVVVNRIEDLSERLPDHNIKSRDFR